MLCICREYVLYYTLHIWKLGSAPGNATCHGVSPQLAPFSSRPINSENPSQPDQFLGSRVQTRKYLGRNIIRFIRPCANNTRNLVLWGAVIWNVWSVGHSGLGENSVIIRVASFPHYLAQMKTACAFSCILVDIYRARKITEKFTFVLSGGIF